MPIEIEIYCEDATELAKILKQRQMIFDRIDVSNISDENYVGINKVLEGWAPLLNKANKHATLITLFINWHLNLMPGEEECNEIFSKYGSETAFKAENAVLRNNSGIIRGLLDDSGKFRMYLKEKMKNRSYGVVERKKHKIVPYCYFASISAAENCTLKEDDLYYPVFVSKGTLRERYVEWCFE